MVVVAGTSDLCNQEPRSWVVGWAGQSGACEGCSVSDKKAALAGDTAKRAIMGFLQDTLTIYFDSIRS